MGGGRDCKVLLSECLRAEGCHWLKSDTSKQRELPEKN